MLDLSHNLLQKMCSLTYVMNLMPSYPERWKKRRWTRVELWNPCSFKHLPPGDNTSVGTWVELQECDQPKLGELAGMYPPSPPPQILTSWWSLIKYHIIITKIFWHLICMILRNYSVNLCTRININIKRLKIHRYFL